MRLRLGWEGRRGQPEPRERRQRVDEITGAADEAQRGEPLERVRDESDLGTWVAGAPPPVRPMLARQPAHERVQLAHWTGGVVIVRNAVKAGN